MSAENDARVIADLLSAAKWALTCMVARGAADTDEQATIDALRAAIANAEGR